MKRIVMLLALAAGSLAAQTKPFDPVLAPENLPINSLFISGATANFTLSPQNIQIAKGYAKELKIGEATLTRASVLALVDTLKKYRDNTIPALRSSYAASVRQAVIASNDEQTYAMLSKMLDADLDKIVATITAQIAELTKLADALAETEARK